MNKRKGMEYLRHFHLRGVPKDNDQLLVVDFSFRPEWIDDFDNECDYVPGEKIIKSPSFLCALIEIESELGV